MEEKIKCLYYIKDLRTDTIIYIGQTADYILRKYEHFRKNEKPIDLYMFEEGRENFIMEMFSDIDCTDMSDEEILKKEDELILYYDTINNGLNKKRSGCITKMIGYKNFNDKRYYQNNKEHCREYNRAYNRKYYQEHKEKMREYYKQYCRKKKQQKLANETS